MYWMNNGSNLAVFLMYAFFGLALVLVAVVLYVFALLAKFDNTVMETLKNALVLSMHHLGQTFVMLLATVILIVVTVKYFTAAILTVPICLYVNSYILARVLKIYATPKTDETEEPEE
jgi:uncharacterized membrane protein YesL